MAGGLVSSYQDPGAARALAEEGTGLSVELDNAANACLLAETWFGRMDGVRNAVLVTISEGLGTGILSNGQILYGDQGMAGEFGHIPQESDGPLCGCGARGCWGMFASSSAALRYYAESKPKIMARTIEDLLRLAEEEDLKAIAALTRQAKDKTKISATYPANTLGCLVSLSKEVF